MVRGLARINLAATQRNAAVLCARLAPGTRLCACVKARASGHGAIEVARAALAGGASSLCVATAQEAAALRAGGLTEVPILVLGALSEEELAIAVGAGADVTAWDERFVAALAGRAAARAGAVDPVRVHVKLDTGLGRLGTRSVAQAHAVADAIAAAPGLVLHAAMTHFATADTDPEFMAVQLAAFMPFARALKDAGVPLAHAANSAATLRDPATHLDMVRCGIALHGCDPFDVDPAPYGLEPVLELSSYVAAVKAITPGESAGYGRRFIAERPTWIATLPIGYADGVRRTPVGAGEVLVAGRRHPIVGRVSMDNTTVDLGPGDRPPVDVGEPAVLIGASGAERLLVEEVARRAGTIHHDVLCGISDRVTRRHHRDGAPASG